MLYLLFDWLNREFDPPGFDVFQFITVRATLAAATALLFGILGGKRIIRSLRRRQLGEQVRQGVDAGAVDHRHKAGTPTMGGVILLVALGGSTLLWGDLTNPYVWIVLLGTLWMGAIGFADDYIKVVKRDKRGVAARVKLGGQLVLGLAVATALLLLPRLEGIDTATSLPLVPNGTIDYDVLSPLVGFEIGWIVYVLMTTFVLTAMSNAVNLTDGLDGLATGTAAFVALGLIALAYITGNAIAARFVNDLFLPGAGEVTVFAAAMAAACFGFLWYNGYPAQVFMGDTGALALGAAIGTVAIVIKKELYLPVLGGIYAAEAASVVLQTAYFKWTRRRYGQGRRLFRMAPLHHHYEASGTHEAKITVRFWIVTTLLVLFTMFLLRIR